MSKPARTIWVCPDLCNEPQTTRKEHEYMSCRHCRDVSGRPKSCMAIKYVRVDAPSAGGEGE